ncbi:hypothetical protein N0V90_003794 [Kalmusia sp. IMI 367209]|nr:hypothetical protein N0V90_003794 [Kalmusia sp. IMI 367209]
MLSNRRAARPLRLVLLIAVLYVLYWVSGFPRTYDDDELPPNQRPNEAASAVHLDQLIVSVKTTTSNAWAELPPLLLLTDPAYHDTLLLMGDLQLNLGQFRVEDVLDRYTESFVAENEELERYRKTLDFAVNSIDFIKLKERDLRKEKQALAKLDKYKILRWIERTWLLRPERRWYLFTEPDVYLVRPNLLSWLGGYDPGEHHFFANAPVPDSGHTFILSEGAMRAIMVDRPDLIPYYDGNILGHKNAFEILTTVLSTTLNLNRTGIWPGVSEFNPATVPFGSGFWCEHVLAVSNMSADLLGEMRRFERDRQDEQTNDPLSFADLWFRFMQPEDLDEPRDDWDNLSSGPGHGQWNILFEDSWHEEDLGNAASKAKSGEDSWEACLESCNENELCVQWSYSSVPTWNDNKNGDTKCHLSRNMKFGSHVDAQELEQAGKERMAQREVPGLGQAAEM